MRLLLVEDEPELSAMLLEALAGESYAVDLAIDGDSADELMAVNQYDAVILDWTIPAPSGIELLSRWRSAGLETPVLMLTGRANDQDKVDGLDSGADDYLTKPFSLVELMARIRSLLRRREKTIPAMKAGDLILDRAGRKVTVAGAVIDLQPKEFGILEYLLTRGGETVTREELAEHVWDDSFDSMSNVIDVLMYRIRKKVDGNRSSKLLHTVRGVGYRLLLERS